MPIKIGGILYPSQQWYDENITGKGKQAVGGREVAIETKIAPDTPDQTAIIDPSPDVVIPNNNELGEGTGDIDLATSTIASLRQELLDRDKAEEVRLQAAGDVGETELTRLLAEPTAAEQKATEFAGIGVDPADVFAQQKADTVGVERLITSRDDLIAKKERAISEVGLQPMMESIQDQLRADAAFRFDDRINALGVSINSQLAIMEMKRGNFEQAQDFVNESVNDYMRGIETEITRTERFLELNEIALQDVDDDIRDTLNEVLQTQQDAAVVQRVEAEKVGALLIEYPNSNIKIGDSLSEAQRKAAAYKASHPEEFITTAAGEIVPTDLAGIINALPSAVERTGAFGMVEVIQKADRVMALLNAGVQTGAIEGRKQSAAAVLGNADPNFVRLQSLMGELAAAFQKSISGAAISEPEAKRLGKFLPSVNKQENVNVLNMEQLVKSLREKYEFSLGVKLSDFPEIPVTSFSLGDALPGNGEDIEGLKGQLEGEEILARDSNGDIVAIQQSDIDNNPNRFEVLFTPTPESITKSVLPESVLGDKSILKSIANFFKIGK